MFLKTLIRFAGNIRDPIYPCRNYKSLRKMQNVYIRRQEGDECFQVSFQLKNETLGLDRQFNFSRQLSEKVNDFLSRVSSSIERILSKKKKRKKSEDAEEGKIAVSLLCEGQPVQGDKECREVLFNSSGLCLKVLDSTYFVVINAPHVSVLTLPGSIMAGFPVYPMKFETMFAEQSLCTFSWFKNAGVDKAKKVPIDWTEVGSGYFYTPDTSDIGTHLKLICEPKRGEITGPPAEAVSTNTVEAGPGSCPFDFRHAFTTERLTGSRFRVVSYNILADLYADSDVARSELFPYCPPYAINIDYRKQLILKELLRYNADIICLQEVDSKVYNYDLTPTLSSVGYSGVFNKKGGGAVAEGLACLFHESRFKLVSSHIIHLGEELKTNPIYSEIWDKIKRNEALATRIMERTTSSQFVVLDSVDNKNERIVVANTHQYFHPDADHIRLLQTGMTVMFLEHLIAETAALDKGKRVSCLFCGDFNSTPEWGVYRLITTQHVPEDLRDWASNEEERVQGVSLSHSLQLSSAYGTPEFTNYTAGFAGCLDYIFYQNDQIETIQVVPLPSAEELQEHTALPSVVFPSDHIALVADLSWK